MIKNVQGIVLTGMKYRESGKILRIFTREYGILSVLAQGVYKRNSALLSVTEIFAESVFDLDPGGKMYYLRQAELVDLHYPLRKSLEILDAAQSAATFLLRSLPEEAPQADLYEAFLELLTLLPDAVNPKGLAYAYILQATARMGYRPYLAACTNCGNRKIKAMTFSHSLRGILCENCRLADVHSQSFSKDFYFAVYSLLHTRLKEISLNFPSVDIAQLELWIKNYVKSVFEF